MVGRAFRGKDRHGSGNLNAGLDGRLGRERRHRKGGAQLWHANGGGQRGLRGGNLGSRRSSGWAEDGRPGHGEAERSVAGGARRRTVPPTPHDSRRRGVR